MKTILFLLLIIPQVASATVYHYTTMGVGGYFQLYGDNFDSRGIDGTVNVSLEDTQYPDVYKFGIDAVLHPDSPGPFETLLLTVNGYVNDVEGSGWNWFDQDTGAFGTEAIGTVLGNFDGLQYDTIYGRVEGNQGVPNVGMFFVSGFDLNWPNLSVVEIGLFASLRFNGAHMPEPATILLLGLFPLIFRLRLI